jgi:hypothetical protein
VSTEHEEDSIITLYAFQMRGFDDATVRELQKNAFFAVFDFAIEKNVHFDVMREMVKEVPFDNLKDDMSMKDHEVVSALLLPNQAGQAAVKSALTTTRTADSKSSLCYTLRYWEHGQKLRAAAATWASSFVSTTALVQKMKRLEAEMAKLEEKGDASTLADAVPFAKSFADLVADAKNNEDFEKFATTMSVMKAFLEAVFRRSELSIVEKGDELVKAMVADDLGSEVSSDAANVIQSGLVNTIPTMMMMVPHWSSEDRATKQHLLDSYGRFAHLQTSWAKVSACPPVSQVMSNVANLERTLHGGAANEVIKGCEILRCSMTNVCQPSLLKEVQGLLVQLNEAIAVTYHISSREDLLQLFAGEVATESLKCKAAQELPKNIKPLEDVVNDLIKMYTLPANVSGIVGALSQEKVHPQMLQGFQMLTSVAPLLPAIIRATSVGNTLKTTWDFLDAKSCSDNKKAAVASLIALGQQGGPVLTELQSLLNAAKLGVANAKRCAPIQHIVSALATPTDTNASSNAVSWLTMDLLEECMVRAMKFVAKTCDCPVEAVATLLQAGINHMMPVNKMVEDSFKEYAGEGDKWMVDELRQLAQKPEYWQLADGQSVCLTAKDVLVKHFANVHSTFHIEKATMVVYGENLAKLKNTSGNISAIVGLVLDESSAEKIAEKKGYLKQVRQSCQTRSIKLRPAVSSRMDKDIARLEGLSADALRSS